MYQSGGTSLGTGNQVGVNGIGEKSPCLARLRLRGCESRQPWRDARCLGLHLGRRRHADKFAGLDGRRSPNPKPICCWGSAWSSPWPPRACARWRAADPMRKPPGEKYEAALELLWEPRLLAQPSTAFQVIPPVHRTNLQGALRVDLTRSPRHQRTAASLRTADDWSR